MNRFWFNVGLSGFGGWLIMAAYLIIWVKYIKKYEGEWEDYWPQAIPIATAMAVCSLLTRSISVRCSERRLASGGTASHFPEGAWPMAR